MQRYELIPVFLDTTAFRENPKRSSPSFALVQKLAEMERLDLYLSEITRREFITQQEEEFDKQVQKIESAAKSIRSRQAVYEMTSVLGQGISSLKDRRGEIEKEFDDWLSKVNAKVQAVKDSHGNRVLDKYFKGAPPFKGLKTRGDIPDAFLFEALSELDPRALHVVTNDSGLAEAVRKLGVAEIHETVSAFVEAASLQGFLHRTVNLQAVVARLAEDAKERKDYLVDPILDELTVTPSSPMEPEHDFAITGYGALDDFEFSSELAEDYGDGMFVVPFSGSSKCLTAYCMAKSEWYALDEQEIRGSVTSWNDHVFMLENEQVLHFSGSLLFQADLEKLNSETDAPGIAAVASTAKLNVEIDEVRFAIDVAE